eukprot:6088184-Heterocapsa_arctica.AAC.1
MAHGAHVVLGRVGHASSKFLDGVGDVQAYLRSVEDLAHVPAEVSMFLRIKTWTLVVLVAAHVVRRDRRLGVDEA